ncbi:MAG: hypothetical protein AAF363_15790 [Bacteroidota bacterium]
MSNTRKYDPDLEMMLAGLNPYVNPHDFHPDISKNSNQSVLENASNQIPSKPSKHQHFSELDNDLNGVDDYTLFQSGEVKINPSDLYTLPGEIGKFIGTQQKFRSAYAIDGEAGAGKSELVMQMANGFASINKTVAYFDLEKGGLESKDTIESRNRNVESRNNTSIKFAGYAPNGISTILKHKDSFDVIIIDSWQKLGERTADLFDSLRQNFPDKIWIVIFQQTTTGRAKGGTGSTFDAPVVIKVFRPNKSTHLTNYCVLEKNRGNDTAKVYSQIQKKVFSDYQSFEDQVLNQP